MSQYAGILSAYGMALADVVYEQQEPCFKPLNADIMKNYINERILNLKNNCKKYLIEKEGFIEENISMRVYLNIRYQGTDTGIMTSIRDNHDDKNELTQLDFEKSFLERYMLYKLKKVNLCKNNELNFRYQNEYGFTMPNRLLIVDDIRVRATAKTGIQARTVQIKERDSKNQQIEVTCVI